MVNKCSAFGCRSGYNRVTDDTQKITFHRFPVNNKDLCEKWIQANPRQDFIASKHSTICSLHFTPTDFVETRTDTNVARRKRNSKVTEKLVRRYLKKDAVPSLFPIAPEYLSEPGLPSGLPRTTVNAASSSRLGKEARRFSQLEESIADDDISDLTLAGLLDELLAEKRLPEGFKTSLTDDSLLIYWLGFEADMPKISSCITVKPDLTVVASIDGIVVPTSQFSDILISGQLKQMSQLVNLMARIKFYTQSHDSGCRPLGLSIQSAIDILKLSLDNMDDDESDEYRNITFIVAQLQFVSTSPAVLAAAQQSTKKRKRKIAKLTSQNI